MKIAPFHGWGCSASKWDLPPGNGTGQYAVDALGLAG